MCKKKQHANTQTKIYENSEWLKVEDLSNATRAAQRLEDLRWLIFGYTNCYAMVTRLALIGISFLIYFQPCLYMFYKFGL